MCVGSAKGRHGHEVGARDRVRCADHPGAAVPGAVGRGGRELVARQPGDRRHLADRLAESSDLFQLRPGLEQVLHGRALLGHRTLYDQLPDAGDPSHRPLHLAGRSCRLFDLALAFSRRSVRIRAGDAWHLPAGTNEVDPLGGRAARSLADEHHRRFGPDPYRPGHGFHDVVLPQLLSRYSPGPAESGANRRGRLLPDFLADHIAALAPDPDRDRDLPVYRDLERIPLWCQLYLWWAAAGHRGVADAAGVFVWRTIFPERPHRRGPEMMGASWQR